MKQVGVGEHGGPGMEWGVGVAKARFPWDDASSKNDAFFSKGVRGCGN